MWLMLSRLLRCMWQNRLCACACCYVLFPSEKSVEQGMLYHWCFRFVLLSCHFLFFAYSMHARGCFSDYGGIHAEESVFVAPKGTWRWG